MGGAFIFCKKRANTWVRPYGLKESLHHRFAMVSLPLGKEGNFILLLRRPWTGKQSQVLHIYRSSH